MDKKQIEVRNVGFLNRDVSTESRHISGYAIVFGQISDNLPFHEVIDRNAITQELLDESDVYLTFNHDDNRILGRSNKGVGSLTLTLDETGLKFDIDAPNTDLGDTVLEYINRGDMDKCSFAFCMSGNPEDEEWSQSPDGQITRIIKRIAYLHDVSVVWVPAYESTSVSARSMDKFNELTEMINREEDKKEEELKDAPEEQPKKEEDVPAEQEETPKDEEQPQEDVKEEDKPEDKEGEEDKPQDEEEKEDIPEEEEKETDNKQNQNRSIKMEKKFSLVKAIRSIAENKVLDAETQAVIDAGKQELRSAGVAINGQIQIPVESRAAITVTAEGEDVVVTDFANILEPLRTKNVLAESGANILTGLVGDFQIPVMTAENVAWEGETTSAKDGAGTFTNVKLTPHRLSAYIDISKQMLVQDSLGVEALIRKDLINAIQSKLEDTIFGTEASGNGPAGIFNSVTPTSVKDFKGLCELEATVEDANFYGDAKYIVSPKAKAALRAMAKSTKSTQLVLEGDNIDGTPVLSTGHIASETFAYGDWSSLYVGQWGAIDLTVDPYTKAADGMVRVVVNAFFDAKVAREGGIAYGTVATV